MNNSLEGKIALITGGGSGIGRSAALIFAREGARVIVADINEAGGQETVSMVQETGAEAMFVKTDVTQSEDVEAMVRTTVETYGRLDCAFNNAGILGSIGLITVANAEEIWHQVINTNLTGVWHCLRHEIKQMLKQGGGVIVNTASVAGVVGINNAAYTASKHGVIGLTKSTAITYAKQGIRVNAVCPTFTMTPMVTSVIGDNKRLLGRLDAAQPMGRMGTPEEVAEAAAWLCSDAASYVTGHAMAVDGGLLAQ